MSEPSECLRPKDFLATLSIEGSRHDSDFSNLGVFLSPSGIVERENHYSYLSSNKGCALWLRLKSQFAFGWWMNIDVVNKFALEDFADGFGTRKCEMLVTVTITTTVS